MVFTNEKKYSEHNTGVVDSPLWVIPCEINTKN